MATTVEKSIIIGASPIKVWERLTDFSRWKDWIEVDNPRPKDWGDSMKVYNGTGASTVLLMSMGDTPVQVWKVTEWEAGRKLTVALDSWLGHRTARMDVSITVELSSSTNAETAVAGRLEACFSFPIMGAFLNAFVPMRAQGEQTLSHFLNQLENAVRDA